MSPASLFVSLSCTVAFALATTACTVVSGVDGMELRTAAAAPIPAPSQGEAGAFDPFAGDAGQAGSPSPRIGGDDGGRGGGAGTGPATCGSQGSWTTCDATVSLATCATRCALQGLTCVESCCANDSTGTYAAKAGMVYAVLPAVECAVESVSASSRGGLCADPTLLATGGAAQVRCCCK